ncbi:uncharacterized protein LOC119734416 [Patiria miniata]|uniref:MYND-type domain-containing protein n=1 Tax=Patiria miniata TaxID=46514 RepID=A0A914AJW1_PATMI|nr:uncharacterized protein LOC119734416 [Patiria miniata]
MDVKPGNCWRCMKPLPESLVTCGRCPQAKYCSDQCQEQDRVRHGAVECQMFGPKSCSYCKKTGEMKQCAGCNNAWYCNGTCQRKSWAAHKEVCQDIQAMIADLSLELTNKYTDLAKGDVTHTRETFLDPPYYFGNTMACDFLQLGQNEWADGIRADETMRDFHILSAGCGDLRHTVLTAASLPAEYQGKVHIVLNDLDPYVMARNVLFLYMLILHKDREGIAASLATLWYSLHISKCDYNLTKTSLRKLIQADARSIQEAMKGCVSISDEDLAKLRYVWKGWYSLECERIKSSSVNLTKQRQAVFAENFFFSHELQLYYERLSPKEAKNLKTWFQRGLFLAQDSSVRSLPFDNPTLTARRQQIVGGYMEATDDFVYCIHRNLTPFTALDSLQVQGSAGETTSTPTVMYHKYVEKQLQKTSTLLAQDRLHIHMLVSSCLEIPRHHQAQKMAKFDRIFTSNLADFVGCRKLLQTLRPLMNPNNKNATLVTETMNWILYMPEANVWDERSGRDINDSTKTTMQLCKDDTGKALSSPMAISNQIEYFNNTHWFCAYLRANMMAGGFHIPELDHIPNLKEAMKCEGLQMHDFREELNKLVPFKFRVNARSLTSPTGAERALEWYLPSDR